MKTIQKFKKNVFLLRVFMHRECNALLLLSCWFILQQMLSSKRNATYSADPCWRQKHLHVSKNITCKPLINVSWGKKLDNLTFCKNKMADSSLKQPFCSHKMWDYLTFWLPQETLQKELTRLIMVVVCKW